MAETKLTITPFQVADGVYYRLNKQLNKRDLGTVLVSCKVLLEKFKAKVLEDYEVWAFVDTLIYQMRKHQFPMVFRMFYSIASKYMDRNVYDSHITETSSDYNSWIEQEINRLKGS